MSKIYIVYEQEPVCVYVLHKDKKVCLTNFRILVILKSITLILYNKYIYTYIYKSSCAQVHELPQSHCGDNREGTLFS